MSVVQTATFVLRVVCQLKTKLMNQLRSLSTVLLQTLTVAQVFSLILTWMLVLYV